MLSEKYSSLSAMNTSDLFLFLLEKKINKVYDYKIGSAPKALVTGPDKEKFYCL